MGEEQTQTNSLHWSLANVVVAARSSDISSCCLSSAPRISVDMSEGRLSNLIQTACCVAGRTAGFLRRLQGAAVTRDCGVMNTHAPNEGFVWRAAVARSRATDPLTAAISCLPCRVTSSRSTPPLLISKRNLVQICVCQRLYSSMSAR